MTTILQISDLHLMSKPTGTLKAVPTAKSFEMVLKRARDEVPNPQRVVLSGDLSHEHTVAGYQLLSDLLGDWVERCLLIPGNHDDRHGLRSVFEQVPCTADDDVLFRDDVGEWQLIGLDSHVTGQVYGKLGDDTLDQLQVWLSENKERPTLIFVHHPPVPVNSLWIDKIGLRNSDPLESLIRNGKGVRGIFCGHIHQVFEGRFAGIPFYSTPSTAFQFKPKTDEMQFDLQPPGFRVIELQESEFSTRVVRLNELPFAPDNE